MKYGFILLFSLCAISNTYASTDCLQRPTCEELGYIQTRSQCACFNKDVLPCPFNIKDDNTVFCGDFPCKEKCENLFSFYDGQGNTQKIVNQLGNIGIAAYAATQFYVGDKNGDFGQGKWYLPSIGEWMDFYGVDTLQMTAVYDKSGSLGDKAKLIAQTAKILSSKGVEATGITSTYWSSSEYPEKYSWGNIPSVWTMGTDGMRNYCDKGDYMIRSHGQPLRVRAALYLSEIFNARQILPAPKVGNVMYLDKTWGSAEDYDGSKTPVGIVVSVSENGHDAIILNLKNLTFTSKETVNNFNPDNPYGEAETSTRWAQVQKVNITEIPDYTGAEVLPFLKDSCNCACQFYQPK